MPEVVFTRDQMTAALVRVTDWIARGSPGERRRVSSCCAVAHRAQAVAAILSNPSAQPAPVYLSQAVGISERYARRVVEQARRLG